MATYCYVGTPGSGKSLHMARYIWADLNQKKECYVIANIPINLEKMKHPERFKLVTNDELKDAANLIDLATKYWSCHTARSVDDAENRIHLYIDEAQILFNARDWQQNSKGKQTWPWFFSVHRHYGFRIVLCTQMLSNLDKQVRGNVEYTIQHRKVTNYGMIGFFLGLILPSLFVSIEVWQPIQQKLSSSFFIYRKKYGEIYNTHALFTSGESGEALIKIDAENNKNMLLIDGCIADIEEGGIDGEEETGNIVAGGNIGF